MEEQSDTPRMSIKFSGELGMSLLNRIAQLERERDEARALNVEWSKKAETWMASPEAAQRLQGYRELGQQVAKAQNERDEARAEVERLRKVLHRLACLGNGDQYGNSFGNDIAREALAATEAKP
jgi:hypothetical protein